MGTVAPIDTASCQRLLDVLEGEAAAVWGSRQRIESACAALRESREQLAGAALGARLEHLAQIVSARVAGTNAPIVSLLCELAEDATNSWPILDRLFESGDSHVVALALSTLAAIVSRNPPVVDDRILNSLAARADRDSGPFAERGTLETIASILRSAGVPLETLCAGDGPMPLRRLAARLLDLAGTPPRPGMVVRIAGRKPGRWLAPYLAWTRATHLDLVAIAAGSPLHALESLQEAEKICGAALLRQLIADIGWRHLNLGITVRRYVGISVGGSFPLLVSRVEARLLQSSQAAGDGTPPTQSREVFDRFLVIAHGGEARDSAMTQDAAIARFRAYNLAHAELLGGFLDVAPLTVAKVRATVAKMDRIVEDFLFLFASRTDECPLLESLYRDLRAAIEAALANETAAPGKPLSPALTRLVDMFEDPQRLSDVHTLHGLKRYLHQRGLKLGMLLAESGRGANRTVTLAVAAADRVIQTVRAFEYVDFEAEEIEAGVLPYAVQLAVDEFGRQLVHAEQPLPKVKVFCYGNEVHYFVQYRNHPAFVRIDFSPPGRGGMIDLAYFGVSKYELSDHPNTSLPVVERFFRRLDFDIGIENTHVHARYDKERAFDLADLCAKAASLFRLAPYLMEVDWIVGDLALSSDGRDQVARAWSDFFATWGVLPYRQFLTADRQGILAAIEPPADREIRWDGEGPYRDLFTAGTPDDLCDSIRAALETHALARVIPFDAEGPLTQLTLESRLLLPFRDACARGEVVIGETIGKQGEEWFDRRHPAACLAEVLRADAEVVERSARLADIITVLARGLRFRTSGAINGYEVQVASLPLPGRTLGLYVLRDASGIFRLALCADGDSLHLRRESFATAARENWSVDGEPIAALLRHANYPVQWPPTGDPPDVESIRESFRNENPHAALPPLPGERLVSGVAASPGRSVGRALLGLEGREPPDVEGSIVVCPSMSPSDGAFMSRSAGVVSTGGGALSHAGLLALQYGKPALIIGGTWERKDGRPSSLVYRAVHYDERERDIGGYRVVERHDIRERDERLLDGDLVVLDADEGLLGILGQEPDGLALHDSMRQLAIAGGKLSAAASDQEILVERGRRLRARHQLEKVLGRLSDPVLARHATTELLLHDRGAEASASSSDKGELLRMLLRNPATGEQAQAAVQLVVDTLARRLEATIAEAMRHIPQCLRAWEVLSLRLDVLQLAAAVDGTRELLAASGIGLARTARRSHSELELLATRRVRDLRAELLRESRMMMERGDILRLRHAADELDRIGLVLAMSGGERATLDAMRDAIEAHDQEIARSIAGLRIVDGRAGAIELRSAIGSKAANLAEAAHLGLGSFVPPWFVVTDCAFREALEARVAGEKPQLVLDAVDAALSRTDLTNAQKTASIRQTWDSAILPDALVDDVKRAYRSLSCGAGAPGGEGVLKSAPHEGDPFVAVRSSASEEDLEAATRAGEFDTFLFIRGEDDLITWLKRAWSGLWSERALHNRALLGMMASVGGGIVVQKMIASRAAGVLHTVNVAERRLREMVINAGLGLGEGIVSGAVAADRIIVSKEGDLQQGELHFRYLTADKRERVVFNSRVGSGTARVETLYHQRLRPALEYVEICQLVRAAAQLEKAYGYPLDIEFAIEGAELYLLQVRPIPTPFAVWRDTVERWPFKIPRVAQAFEPAPLGPAGEPALHEEQSPEEVR